MILRSCCCPQISSILTPPGKFRGQDTYFLFSLRPGQRFFNIRPVIPSALTTKPSSPHGLPDLVCSRSVSISTVIGGAWSCNPTSYSISERRLGSPHYESCHDSRDAYHAYDIPQAAALDKVCIPRIPTEDIHGTKFNHEWTRIYTGEETTKHNQKQSGISVPLSGQL